MHVWLTQRVRPWDRVCAISIPFPVQQMTQIEAWEEKSFAQGLFSGKWKIQDSNRCLFRRSPDVPHERSRCWGWLSDPFPQAWLRCFSPPSCLSGFLPSTKSCSGSLCNTSFLISVCFYKFKYFLQPFWRYHNLYWEILIYPLNGCLASEKWVFLFLNIILNVLVSCRKFSWQ